MKLNLTASIRNLILFIFLTFNFLSLSFANEVVEIFGTSVEGQIEKIEIDESTQLILVKNVKIPGSDNSVIGDIIIIPTFIDINAATSIMQEAISNNTYKEMPMTQVGLKYNKKEINLGEVLSGFDISDDLKNRTVKVGRFSLKSAEGYKGASLTFGFEPK